MTQTKYTKKRKVRKVSKSKKYTKKGGSRFLNKLRKRRQIILEKRKEEQQIRKLGREQSQQQQQQQPQQQQQQPQPQPQPQQPPQPQQQQPQKQQAQKQTQEQILFNGIINDIEKLIEQNKNLLVEPKEGETLLSNIVESDLSFFTKICDDINENVNVIYKDKNKDNVETIIDRPNVVKNNIIKIITNVFLNNSNLLNLFKNFIDSPNRYNAIILLNLLKNNSNILGIFDIFKKVNNEKPQQTGGLFNFLKKDKQNQLAIEKNAKEICKQIKENKDNKDNTVKEALDGNIFSFLLGLICTSNFLTKFVEQLPRQTNIPIDMPSIIKFILRKIGKFGKRIMNHFINRLKKRSESEDNYIKDLQKIFKEVEDASKISEELIDYLLKNLIEFLNSEARKQFTVCPTKETIKSILENNKFFDDLYRTLFDTSLLWHLPLAAAEKLIFLSIKQVYCGQKYSKTIQPVIFNKEVIKIYNETNKNPSGFHNIINDDTLPENIEGDIIANTINPFIATNTTTASTNTTNTTNTPAATNTPADVDTNPVVNPIPANTVPANTANTATVDNPVVDNNTAADTNNPFVNQVVDNPINPINPINPSNASNATNANPVVDNNPVGNSIPPNNNYIEVGSNTENVSNNVKKNLNNLNSESTAGGSRKLTKKRSNKTNKQKTTKRKTNKKLNKKLNNHKRVI